MLLHVRQDVIKPVIHAPNAPLDHGRTRDRIHVSVVAVPAMKPVHVIRAPLTVEKPILPEAILAPQIVQITQMPPHGKKQFGVPATP
jgi:hypothetical protein